MMASLMRLLTSVALIVVLAPWVQAADCPKGIPSVEYSTLVDRYRSGDHAGAISALGSWQDVRLECDWKALQDAAKKAAKCVRCPEKVAFESFSVRAALLLHADREVRENLRAPVSEQAPPSCRVGAHARAVERLADVLQAVDRGAPDFLREFYLGLARHAHWSHCLGIAQYWAHAGLARVPRDGPLLLTLGIAAENDAFHLRAPTSRSQGMSGKQRDLWEDAQRTFEEALLADPELHEARLRLGRVLMRLGKIENARACFEAVAAKDAEDAVTFLARMFLGRVEQDAGRLAEAEKEYVAALELKPASQPATVAVSHVRQLQGDTEGARAVLQRFLAYAHRRTEIDPFINYLMAHTASGERLLEELRRANGK
jgi:tetratricopeptide (TPR) repeat protein